jgi:putative spermidine/putrescine transport system substrate-binding protein
MAIMTRARIATLLAGAGLIAVALAGGAYAQDSITVASWGGAYQEAQSKAFFQPAAKALGITIKEDTTNGLSDVRLQVSGNAVKWDLAELGADECARGHREGLFEKLDYDVIKADGIPEKLVREDWIGITYYSVVLIYNTKKYGDNGPKTWADFWNVEKFPGKRALGNFPNETLTVAALADGVPPDQVYPLDMDRAFKSLERIKPHVSVWWDSGGQAMQLVKDGEVDMASIWNGRASVLVADGAPVKYTFDQGVFNPDCMVIPKGAKNKDLAMKALAAFVSPDLQANLPLYIGNGPVNTKAFETGKIPAEKQTTIVSAPENVKKQMLLDFDFWADHLVEAEERFNDFLQQ